MPRVGEWLAKSAVTEVEDDDVPDAEDVGGEDRAPEDHEIEEGYREAAE